jgi:hypothetical protein
MTKCFAGLREMLLEEKLGFLDPETLGKNWLLDLNKILYHISPYYANFKARGFTMDKA